MPRHLKFWKLHLAMLPSPYVRGDDQRMTFAYFCLSALDLLQQVHDVVDEKERNEYIDWVYDQQMSADQGGGFRGSPAASTGHITMTYTALLILAILRDNFARLDRQAISVHLSGLQQLDGSFICAQGSLEKDVRFSYCAFAIAYILDDWSLMDQDRAIQYMLECQHYEAAFAQEPHLESHGM